MPGCKDPQGCREKAERLKMYLSGVLPVAEERWEDLKQQGRVLHKTKHLITRMYERAISDKDIEDVVENGWPIEYFFEIPKVKETFILMGYTRRKRPLHLVVSCEGNEIYLSTVYDPRFMPWKWENGYQVKKCFCKDEGEEI